MKIQRIKIQNFLGISMLDINVKSPILGVFGGNCSGKSSLANSLRFVLLNDLCRVEHRKNVKSLMKDGAKTGSVELTVDGAAYQRSAVTGHIVSRGEPPDPHHPALPYLLDHAAFAALDQQSRRAFLYNLMGVSLSKAGIMDELEARGHSRSLVNRIATCLVSGFPHAHTEAQGVARETKGRWRQLTGETYGEVKAEAWEVTAPAVGQTDIDRLRNDVGRLDREVATWQTRHGAVAGRREERQRLIERMGQTRRIAEGLSACQSEERRCRHSLAAAATELRALHERLALAENRPLNPTADPKGVTFECPACSTQLHYSSRGVRAVGENEKAEEAQDCGALLRQFEIADKEKANAERHLTNATNAVVRAQAAVDALSDMKQPDDAMESAADIESKVKSFRSQRNEAAQALTALETARAESENAVSRTSMAKLLHEEIKALEALATDLAPDGLPAELLAKAMGPINQRLRDSAGMTGWPLAVIDTDQIWISGVSSRRPLRFASASERWRIDAMITEAIAYLSGIKLFVLDGLDILEPASRAQAIAWLAAIAAEHQIIVMATLKQPPENMPGAIQSVWLGEAVR